MTVGDRLYDEASLMSYEEMHVFHSLREGASDEERTVARLAYRQATIDAGLDPTTGIPVRFLP